MFGLGAGIFFPGDFVFEVPSTFILPSSRSVHAMHYGCEAFYEGLVLLSPALVRLVLPKNW
jgi:hypothetical protein